MATTDIELENWQQVRSRLLALGFEKKEDAPPLMERYERGGMQVFMYQDLTDRICKQSGHVAHLFGPAQVAGIGICSVPDLEEQLS